MCVWRERETQRELDIKLKIYNIFVNNLYVYVCTFVCIFECISKYIIVCVNVLCL